MHKSGKGTHSRCWRSYKNIHTYIKCGIKLAFIFCWFSLTIRWWIKKLILAHRKIDWTWLDMTRICIQSILVDTIYILHTMRLFKKLFAFMHNSIYKKDEHHNNNSHLSFYKSAYDINLLKCLWVYLASILEWMLLE